MFSQFHARVSFIGAAKLAISTPLTKIRASPMEEGGINPSSPFFRPLDRQKLAIGVSTLQTDPGRKPSACVAESKGLELRQYESCGTRAPKCATLVHQSP